MTRRKVLGLGLATLSAPLVMPLWARAQARYPERAIRLVIPFPPGGVNDAVGRPWADKMKGLLGTVVVENMGGAGGAVGALAVARAASPLVRVAPYRIRKVGIISTVLPGLADKVIEKTLRVTQERLMPAGAKIVAERRVAHESAPVARALSDFALAPGRNIKSAGRAVLRPLSRRQRLRSLLRVLRRAGRHRTRGATASVRATA